MGLPNEYSLECEICGGYNIQEGFILDGKIYCWNCIKQPDILSLLKRMRVRKRKRR